MWKLSKALRQEEVPPHSPCSESGGIYRSMGFPSEATDTALVTDAPSARSNHQRKQGWAPDNMTSVNLVQLGCPLSFPGAPKTQQQGKLLSALFTNRKESIPLQFSEDCLYLNIYTPADLTKNTRLPVSPFITGPDLWIPASVSSMHWKGNGGSCGQEYYRQELSRKPSDVRPWLRLPCL